MIFIITQVAFRPNPVNSGVDLSYRIYGLGGAKMMNCAFKTRNCVSKTRNFVFKRRNFALKIMNFTVPVSSSEKALLVDEGAILCSKMC